MTTPTDVHAGPLSSQSAGRLQSRDIQPTASAEDAWHQECTEQTLLRDGVLSGLITQIPSSAAASDATLELLKLSTSPDVRLGTPLRVEATEQSASSRHPDLIHVELNRELDGQTSWWLHGARRRRAEIWYLFGPQAVMRDDEAMIVMNGQGQIMRESCKAVWRLQGGRLNTPVDCGVGLRPANLRDFAEQFGLHA